MSPLPPYTPPPRVQKLDAFMAARQLAALNGSERAQMILEGDRPCPRYAVLLRPPSPGPGMEAVRSVHFAASRAAARQLLAGHPWPLEALVDLDSGAQLEL